MLYREIIAVCSQIHTKHTNTLCGQNVELLYNGGTYSDQWACSRSAMPTKFQLSVAATTPCDSSTSNATRCTHNPAGLHRMHFAARIHEVAQVNMTSAAEDCVALRGALGTVHRGGRSWFRRYEVVLSTLRGQKYGSAQNGVCVCCNTEGRDLLAQESGFDSRQ
jgi:hypothetical protein